jgi:hypothetical protein
MANRAANRDAKAERLIAEGRCHELACVPGKLWMGVVVGDTGTYTVYDVDSDYIVEPFGGTLSSFAVPAKRGCQCPSFGFSSDVPTERGCSHTDAASKLRTRSIPADELRQAAGA